MTSQLLVVEASLDPRATGPSSVAAMRSVAVTDAAGAVLITSRVHTGGNQLEAIDGRNILILAANSSDDHRLVCDVFQTPIEQGRLRTIDGEYLLSISIDR